MDNTSETIKVKKKIVKKEAVKAAAKHPQKKKKITSIVVFVLGIMMLVAGVVFLVLNILKGNAVADGEYLVAADNWVLTDCGEENCDKVVWDFTEIGKGTLTTDGGEHNYDFQWAIEDGKLLIQTDWLYELDDEYEYSLNQGDGVLTLKNGDDEYQFTAQ